jgi:predicted nucleic acid-binding Zn ribbon protein
MTPKNSFKDVPSVLSNLLKKHKLDTAIRQEQILQGWENIVGRSMAQKCRPLEFENDVLIIQAKDELWKQELALRHDDLVNLVNGRINTLLVKKIKIV